MSKDKKVMVIGNAGAGIAAARLLGEAHSLETIHQVAKGLVNVDQYTKGPAKNHLDVNWDEKSGAIFSFYFGSDNESSVKAMALTTKTPVSFNKEVDVWETSDF